MTCTVILLLFLFTGVLVLRRKQANSQGHLCQTWVPWTCACMHAVVYAEKCFSKDHELRFIQTAFLPKRKKCHFGIFEILREDFAGTMTMLRKGQVNGF